MVLGQRELSAVACEEAAILRLVPVVDRLALQVRLDKWAQVEQVAFLRPDRERIAAARKYIRRHARLHIGEHAFLIILRFGRIEDFDIRMCVVEILQQQLFAQAAAVLEGKLDLAAAAHLGSGWAGAAAG